MAHLLIIELPGGNDADILQAALDGGHEFTFLSACLEHYRRQPLVNALLALARAQIEVPSFSMEEVEHRVRAAHESLPIDAVLCLVDIRLIEAARIADSLGLRYLNPASAALLRDKFSVRGRLELDGIAQPAFSLATSNEELESEVARMGLPVLIKPADGYGSQNIVALRHPEDLDPILNPLGSFLPSGADYGLGVKANDRLLVERFMTGRIIGCDTLTVGGRHTLLGIHEKLFFDPPSFAIRGGCFIPNHPGFTDIERYIFSALDAVSFDWGATHTELMLTSEGPRLIEINPRLVGAKLPRLIGYALDRSIHSDLIAVHLGKMPVPAAARNPALVAVTRWIVADRSGVLENVDLPKCNDNRIRSVELLKSPGENVRLPFENSDRIGFVMVCGEIRAEVECLAEEFISQCRCHIK